MYVSVFFVICAEKFARTAYFRYTKKIGIRGNGFDYRKTTIQNRFKLTE